MTDNSVTNGVQSEPIKTPNDLELESLKNEIQTMKADYDKLVTELKDANKGLWAALHPAKVNEPVNSEPIVKTVKDSADASLMAFNDALGINKEGN